jgi:hypothetical protein
VWWLPWAGLALALLLAACRHTPARHGEPDRAAPRSLEHALGAGQVKDFRLAEKIVGRATTQFTLTNADSVLKVEVFSGLDKEAAETLLQDGIMSLQALYANALSPYPGDISHRIESSPELRPRFLSRTLRGATYSYFLLFTNERLAYGASSQESARYRSLLGWFHCEPAGNFYKVRIFKPLASAPQDLEELFLGLGCP